MTSSNVYKQSVYDHRSILILMSMIDDGSLNTKKYTKLLNNICQYFEIIKIRSLSNNEDDIFLKRVFFNFKRTYSFQEKEWENFQLHHRAVGLMFIGEFKSGLELEKILKTYCSEKDKGVGCVIESRLVLIYDENTEYLVHAIKQNLSSQDDVYTGIDPCLENKALYVECDQEISFIKDSLLQNDIIWYHKSLICDNNTDSCSLTDSVSSNGSATWKLGSKNSDTSIGSPNTMSPVKVAQLYDGQNGLPHSEYREISMFLNCIYEKLVTSLTNRESALTNKTEQNYFRTSGMETSSDSGSMISLDDTDFNLSDPLDPDRKRFQEEHRYSKTNKSRHYLGRLSKQSGDYALLCGNYWQAYYYYQLSICYLKRYNNDQLWLAGAEEGLCCAWIAYNFGTPQQSLDLQTVDILHAKCRQAFSNHIKAGPNQPPSNEATSPPSPLATTDQIDFSFLKKFAPNDLFKSPTEIQSLDDLNDRYLECISRYKKVLKKKVGTVHPINMDSCIKASRFFIDRHRYLQASTFLKMIRSDLSQTDKDVERYHETMAKLYSQMGFARKAAVHKYHSILAMQANPDPGKQRLSASGSCRQTADEKKLATINDILASLGVDTGPLMSEHVEQRLLTLLDNARDRQFESLKMRMVLELFRACRSLDYGCGVVLGLGLSLLDHWHSLLTTQDCQRLVEDLDRVSRASRSDKACSVKNLPRLKAVMPSPLASYLLPRERERPADPGSIFIYTPLAMSASRSAVRAPLAPVVWVCGEECELVLQFDNLLPVSLQLSSVRFLFQGPSSATWVPAEGSSIHLLPCGSRNIHCHFVVIPNREQLPLADYRITDLSYQVISLRHITFQPHRLVLDSVLQATSTASVSLRAAMPQMRLLTSLTEQSMETPLARTTAPPNMVLRSNLSVYESELFEFALFLSNESKSLDIDLLSCSLDELELSSVSCMLVSRISDDEYNNRRQSSHRMLSLLHRELLETLSIKSISSLQTAFSSKTEHPSLPTEATVKFRIDVTNRPFARELFQKRSSNKWRSLDNLLWQGQFRICFRYGCSAQSGMTMTTRPANLWVRESVYALNCHIVLGLSVIGCHLESNLDLVVTLMNFTENKMSVDIFWKEIKTNINYIVIVPNCGQISQSSSLQSQKSISSTECSSHMMHHTINADLLDLKSLVVIGAITSEHDLIKYIQSNLRISWTMKDKSLDKIRHGTVNMTMCLCNLSQNVSELNFVVKQAFAHELSFTCNDIVKIWMQGNVLLEMDLLAGDHNPDHPSLPHLSSDSPISLRVIDSLQFRIRCKFVEGRWALGLPQEIINRIVLKCALSPALFDGSYDGSSDEDGVRFQPYVIGGNSVLIFDKCNTDCAELEGVVVFLVPGCYSMHSQLLIQDDLKDDSYTCRRGVEVLLESSKFDIRVT